MNQSEKLPLNKGQHAAAEAFFDFLFDPNQKEMNISGAGGVGKTFTMAHMIDEIMPRYFATCETMGIKPTYNEVVMTATTNKAAEVLAQATGRPTSTYHSYQGLRVKNNFKTGETEIVPSNNFDIKKNKVIFIDEASMIDRELRKYILEGTFQSKIVYIGDEHQLLPVKESSSPVYSGNIPTYYLTEPMRTSVPELLALNQQLRDTVASGVFNPIKIVPGVIDWVETDEMIALLDTYFKTETNSRITAFTNKQVIDYNTYIRDINGFSGEFAVGERLVSNSAVQISRDDRLSIEQEVSIIERSDKTTKIPITDEIELEVRYCTLDTGYGGYVRDVPIPVDYEYFNNLVKWFAKIKDWPTHYGLKEKYPELRALHACTVHKSQGSSYDTIFIDAADLSNCRIPDTVARLLYVAASRARHRVVFFGELADKYGGLIR